MDTHYEVDETLYHARQLAEPIRRIQTEFDRIKAQFNVMAQMKINDGSAASDFQKVVDQYGVQGSDSAAKLANAKAIYDELNSTIGNSAALLQLLARLG